MDYDVLATANTPVTLIFVMNKIHGSGSINFHGWSKASLAYEAY